MKIMKTALVHDWLDAPAGAESVLEQLIGLWPESEIYTIVDFLSSTDRDLLSGKNPHTSFVQHLPFARNHFRLYLPLFPLAIESFDLSDADIVLSSSHAVAKGLLTHSEQIHISYIHTPMRYAWDLAHQYLKDFSLDKGIRSVAVRGILHYLRNWDALSAHRVDCFVANSKHVAQRIFRTYRRSAEVIYPPVNVNKFALSRSKETYYLAAGRLVPYKNIDLIVRAFASSGRLLKVVGDGPDRKKIASLAGSNIEYCGYLPQEKLIELMQHARAFVFAAHEDFGILPVEAQSTGTPVIAFGRGGSLETIQGVFTGQVPTGMNTGIWFEEQSVASLNSAIDWFESYIDRFDSEYIRKAVIRFSIDRFKREMTALVLEKWTRFLDTGIVDIDSR